MDYIKITYDYILDIKKIEDSYNIVKKNTCHKAKINKWELFYTSNCVSILDKLINRNYQHKEYNIFIISEPKIRVIMSEQLSDKIINHLLSKYVYFPLLEPKLIEMNVASRTNKGSKAGIEYLKKYINSLKENNKQIYILKCDIEKYFYSIDHEILLNKLKKIIIDEDLFNLTKNIINSTDSEYINNKINYQINKKKENANKKLLSELKKIPCYKKGKGLPIGNMSSQIFASFYLNDLDHYIKEELKIKHYIRYVDDFILLHQSKEYLEYCKIKINEKIRELKLNLNSKVQICEIHKGVTFIGYKFILKNNKLLILMGPKFKKKLKMVL